MRTVSFVICLLLPTLLFSQSLREKLDKAMDVMQADSQLRHASISLYIINSQSKETLFDKNSEMGLAPASSLKIITSASGYELLGKDFRFVTYIGYNGIVNDKQLKGDLIIEGHGDPTLGSWRFGTTHRDKVFNKILGSLERKKITSLSGGIYVNDMLYSYQPNPDGWIWQDMGNYFGAGAWGLNWHENKYALNLRPGSQVGEPTEVISTEPINLTAKITNLIRTGPKGSGDRSYIYNAPYSDEIFTTGTIPLGQRFHIYGSMPNPPYEFAKELDALFKTNKIRYNNKFVTYSSGVKKKIIMPVLRTVIDSIISPAYDTINYWFMKESINLYGEAFVKAIGYRTVGEGHTDSGINIIRKFWNKNGIDLSAIKIMDGSGLSPANRVTTHALVQVLEYARDKPWYRSFYHSLPEINGLKMKSGYIGGVRAYAGYIKSKSGNEYTFAFIINNFDGSAGSVREKMFRVLDLLK